MPRKKLATNTDLTETPTPPTEAAAPQKSPKRTKRAQPATAKVQAAPEIALSIEEAPVAIATAPKETVKKTARSHHKKATSEPTPTAPVVVVEPEMPDATSAENAQPKKSSRRRKPAEKVAIPVAAVEEPVVEVVAVKAPAEAKKGRSSRSGKKSAPASAAASSFTPVNVPVFSVDDHLLLGDEDLPIPNWRPRQRQSTGRSSAPVPAPAPALVDAAKEETATAATDAEKGDRAPQPERRNNRSRKPRKPAEAETPRPETTTATEPVKPVAEADLPRPTFRGPAAPKPPVKPAIEIPDNAPQVVLRDGTPTLVRNHRVYPPLMFFGSASDERRANTVLDELRMAAEAGIHLHSFLIDFEVDLEQMDHTTAFAAYMLAKAVEIDPEAQVIFRVTFQAPRGWQDRYMNARYRHADGTVAEPSVCDDEFWDVAKACLERFVKQMRLLPLHENIMGLHLERGEWFFSEGLGYDNSKAAQAKFRDWARTRYNNDEVTLRASWFDGSARFDNIQIPEYRQSGTDDEKFIRSSRKHRRYVDYHLFLSDATVHRIGDLAYTAKAASDGYFLLGASYGYTFEWSHPSSGHLSLGKLLRTPEIDFIAGPPSYRERDPGGSAAFPCPIDSFALNSKLYISEEDFKTSLSTGHEPDDFNPTLKTPQALESAHWRGAGVALAHSTGVAWMDLWGNGWLKTNSVWARASRVRAAMVDRMQTPLGDPEVAIFIDERALAYLVDSHAFELLVQNVRESVLRAGVSAAFYLLSDLAHREKFPDSKLYLFLNAWDVRPELRAAIKSRLQCNDKILFWLYSAGLFDAGRDSLERAREITGIALKPQPFYSKSGTTILNRRHPLSEAFPDKSLIGSTKLEPSYFAIPEGATVLGEYSQTGLPSFVVREFDEGPAEAHWKSVFLGEPVVNAALIRALAQMAGAHVWNFHEDVVHVRAPFCTIHCSGAGPRTITLPNKFSAFNLLTDEWVAVDATNLRFTATDGSTHVFLVGPKEELEHMLETDPASALRIDKLPARESNILGDISNFDVPIMKLDEWMEGGDSEEASEDWFLRPQQIIEEPEVEDEGTEKIGRRRRRRRGRGSDRGGSEETSNPRREPSGSPADSVLGDLGMNVMFRKRE
ncbi:MAG: hypothetical protein P4L46_04190 [Fimbriimonas sp.]|nr:hypothetical protein [Fimbriimonas sp.]